MKGLGTLVVALAGFTVAPGLAGTSAEAKPVSGCPGGYSLMTVESLEATGHIPIPRQIDESGNGDGYVCARPYPDAMCLAHGYDPVPGRCRLQVHGQLTSAVGASAHRRCSGGPGLPRPPIARSTYATTPLRQVVGRGDVALHVHGDEREPGERPHARQQSAWRARSSRRRRSPVGAVISVTINTQLQTFSNNSRCKNLIKQFVEEGFTTAEPLSNSIE